MRHGLVPASGMVLHGVEEHTIHVEHDRLEADVLVVPFLEVVDNGVANSLIVHDYRFLRMQ